MTHMIANGAECEPSAAEGSRVDDSRSGRFFRGLAAMQSQTGASRVTIAVKRKNEDVLPSMSKLAEKPASSSSSMKTSIRPATNTSWFTRSPEDRFRPAGFRCMSAVSSTTSRRSSTSARHWTANR